MAKRKEIEAVYHSCYRIPNHGVDGLFDHGDCEDDTKNLGSL